MTLYRVDVWICGTAYIKAASQKEAVSKSRALTGEWLEVQGANGESEELICERMFDDPELPEVSLSPAMTIHNPIVRSISKVEE